MMQFFKPKLIECLRDYDRRTFFSDLAAGVTVGIVALPLAIGFGIASGVTPAQGLWTAIIAGAIIAALGGSKVQIGGPTGAFVPILAGIVAIHGYAGLALATVMAGIFLVAMGALKLGSLIKFIPYPVIAGFTSGIAIIIFVGQLKEFLGLNAQIQELMAPALTIAVLGAIESLRSAMVADGMIETRHDSNQELIGQGLANIVTPFFGGISATGAIARTATNIRSGGKTPVAGIVHSVALLIIVLVAAPLAKFIPLAALSAVLFVVAYRMGEWDNFAELARGPKSDFFVLLLTFVLTVTFDLTIAVGVGLAMAGALFVKRMEEITQIRLVTPESELELGGDSIREKNVPEDVLVFRIEGPFFFGVAEKLESALARALRVPRVVIFRVRAVPAIAATGLHALEIEREKFHRKRTHILLSGVHSQPMKVLFHSGFVDRIGLDNICANIDAALERAREILSG